MKMQSNISNACDPFLFVHCLRGLRHATLSPKHLQKEIIHDHVYEIMIHTSCPRRKHNIISWNEIQWRRRKKNPVRRFSPHRAFRFFSVPRSCVRDGGIRARLHPSRAKAVERTERERLITAASTEKNRWLCYVWENYFLTVPRSDRLRMPENKLEYKRKCVETRMFILSWALVLERRTFCVALNKKRREKQENKNFSDTKRRK